MRLGLLVAGLLLAAPGLVACGGDSEDDAEDPGSASEGAATAVSVEDFCAAAEEFENGFAELDPASSDGGVVALKEAAQELRDVGTPDDIPDDAREGLELTLDELIALPDDADSDAIFLALDFSEEEKAKSMAFEAYLDESCDYRGGA